MVFPCKEIICIYNFQFYSAKEWSKFQKHIFQIILKNNFNVNINLANEWPNFLFAGFSTHIINLSYSI